MAESPPRRPARPRPAGLPAPSPTAIAAAGRETGARRVNRTAKSTATAATEATAAHPASTLAAAAAADPAADPANRQALLERAGTALADLLDRQAAAHGRLIEQLQEKREALRRADVDRIAACCAAERQLIAEIQRLESQRRDVVVGVTGLLEPGRAEPLPLTEITPHLAAPLGTRLLELRAGLRRSIEEAGRLSAILTAAADAVGTHLAGLVQSVGKVLAGPGTYGRRGRVDATTASPMRLDMTS